MARDMDFHRSKPAPINHDDRRIFDTPPPLKPKKPTKNPSILWPVLIAIVIVGAILAGLYLYYRSLQPVETVSSTNTPAATASASEELLVSVYDRGAGATAATTAVNSLKSAGLNTQLSDSSTVTYTKSYIFYNTANLSQAQKIVQTLPSYQFSLKETSLIGISVYLAKQ